MWDIMTENVAEELNVSWYAGADDHRHIKEMKYIDRVDNKAQMFRPVESFLGGNCSPFVQLWFQSLPTSLHLYFSCNEFAKKETK